MRRVVDDVVIIEGNLTDHVQCQLLHVRSVMLYAHAHTPGSVRAR
jgi:hypothetical protein